MQLDRELVSVLCGCVAPPSYNSPFYQSTEGHLHYFDPGSESLYATTDITSGNANQLAADHMLANPKQQVPAPGRAGWEGLQTWEDPETNAGVQDNYYHIESGRGGGRAYTH